MTFSKSRPKKLKGRLFLKSKYKRSLRNGGAWLKPDKANCEKLFVSKGNKSWKLMNQNNTWRTRMRYSLCKRSHKKLYDAYKNMSQGSTASKARTSPGLLFSPRQKGLNASLLSKINAVERNIHAWLDQNGWTDKNIAKAQKMKVKMMGRNDQ